MQSPDVVQLFSQFAKKIEPNKSFDQVTRDSKITSFGIDSLAMMEIVGCFEDEFGIKIPDERLATLQTVGDIEKVVLAAVQSKSTH